MPRLLCISSAWLLILASPALAETDGEVYEETDRIITQATVAVGENLARFIESNERPLGEARAQLAELIARLNKEGRSQLATSIQKRVNTLEETVQKRATATVPIVPSPKKPLLERMAGKWEWTNHPQYLELTNDGKASLYWDRDNKVVVRGTLATGLSDTSEIRWDNGMKWKLVMAGEDAIAAHEWLPDGNRQGDGLVLERRK